MRIAHVIVALSLAFPALAQDNNLFFFEPIIGDSVRMFFNPDCELTEKHCAFFSRYTRVDAQGNFEGPFRDVTSDGRLLGTGQYFNGNKHGYFEIFHVNKKLMARGHYRNGRPFGKWEMFYDSGLPFRHLLCTETDTLMINQFDPKGSADVVEGNGKFITYSQFTSKYYNQFDVKGSIKNGKAEGTWVTPYTMSSQYFREEFIDGRMIRGEQPNAWTDKTYTRSKLTVFFPRFYYDVVEEFKLAKCVDTVMNVITVTSAFDDKIRAAVKKVIRNKYYRSSDLENYKKHNTFVVEFQVDADGVPKDFRLVSKWGGEYLESIQEIISTYAKFKQGNLKLYFQFKLQFKNHQQHVVYSMNFRSSDNFR
jgi:hypothetical protein